MNIKKDIHVVGIGGTLRANSTSRTALEHALRAAHEQGASTELLALHDLDLPLFVPGRSLGDYPPQVQQLIDAANRADAMIWSTGAYHGTLAGATKNALDFFEFLSDRSYLDGVPVGLIASAGGDMAAVNAINAMAHTVQSLRGTMVPLVVPIGKAWRVFDGETINSEKIARRLEMLGELVFDTALRFSADQIPAFSAS